MRRIAWGLVGLLACSRDLSVPPARTLAVTPTFAAPAPRELVTLQASGGIAPYTAAFAQGSPLSGPYAEIAPVAGQPGRFAYLGGTLGSAQDVVEIRDAAGAVATVRLSVGARLRVTPALAVGAPGERITLVASGGKRDYVFTLADAQPGTTLEAGPGPDEWVVVVGSLGDRIERLLVTDATFDPANAASSASAETVVQVSGALRLYANAPAEVPPFETVDFLAVGGQPPYAFSFVGGSAPSGGRIDSVSGRYTAGEAGGVVDQVVARDALGQQSAPWPLAVAAPLSLELPVSILSPGVAVDLVASGGKPPYTFGFARRGNRSGGSVNASSGAYVPGANQGTADLLAVWDATGVASFVLSEPARIGHVETAIGQPTIRLIEARLRGDKNPDTGYPRDDVVLSHAPTASVTALLLPPDVPPRIASGALTLGTTPLTSGQTFSLDRDGDGREEVVMFSTMGLATLDPDLFGELTLAGIDAPAGAVTARWPLSPSTFNTNFACTCPGASLPCTAASGTGILRIDLATGTRTCDVVLSADQPGNVPMLAAGDWDGDGQVDLAWMTLDLVNLRISYRDGATGVLQAPTWVTLPCPTQSVPSIQADGRLTSYQRSASPADPKSYPVVALACTDASGSRQKLARVDGGAPGTRTPVLSPATPVDLGRPRTLAPLLRAASATGDAAPHVLVFGGQDYTLKAVSFDASGAATVSDALAHPFASTVQWVALPDVNGDDVPDLVAAGTNPNARLLLGDGDGRFGFRGRFLGMTYWAAGDLDGDGQDDLVASDDDPGMQVAFGGGHALGWEPGRVLPGGTGAMAILGPALGGPEIVHVEFTGAMWRTRVVGDGSLQAPESVAVTVQPGFSIPALRSLVPVDFGRDGRVDFWGTSGPLLGVFLRDDPSSARYVQAPTPSSASVSYTGCSILPVGAGTPGWPVEAAAVCLDATDRTVNVLRSSIQAGTSAFSSPWSDVTPPAFLPAEGTLTSSPGILAAGTWGGSAWFVVAPYGDDAVRHRYLVSVSLPTGAAHADPFTVQRWDLGPSAGLGTKSALVGDLDGVDGIGEVAILGYGKLVVLRPAGSSASEVGRVGAAGTSIDAFLRLGAGPERDVLVRAADDGVLLRNHGGASLE